MLCFSGDPIAVDAMRPALWRLFSELAELGSITRVAAARNVAQPHITAWMSIAVEGNRTREVVSMLLGVFS